MARIFLGEKFGVFGGFWTGFAGFVCRENRGSPGAEGGNLGTPEYPGIARKFACRIKHTGVGFEALVCSLYVTAIGEPAEANG